MKKLIILLTVLSFGIYTCGPSVEGESKAWEKNTKSLEKLAEKYPPFAEKIDAQIKKAEAVFESAQSIEDEKKQAEKMQEANDQLNHGCVGKLKNTDHLTKKIAEKSEELRKIRRGLPETDIRYADIVIKDAEQAVSNMNEFLNNLSADYSGDPCQELESNFKSLEIRLDDLETSIKNLKRKKGDMEAEKNQAKDTASVDDKETQSIQSSDKKSAKVECEYCGTMNLAENTECKSCGAPIK